MIAKSDLIVQIYHEKTLWTDYAVLFLILYSFKYLFKPIKDFTFYLFLR